MDRKKISTSAELSFWNYRMLTPDQICRYAPPPNHLEGRIILISGAGDGIGREVAFACAEQGATTILLGRSVGNLESTYDAIIERTAHTPVICPIDLETAGPEEYAQLNLLVNSQFGRLDGLVNNAGILGSRTPMNHYKPQTWDSVLKINVTAQYMLTQALVPTLEVSASGASVIFTTSGVGRRSRAFWGAYAVSKFAIEGLVQTWGQECENLDSFRINAIDPGATRTKMRAEAYPAENPEKLKSPSEIMPAYLYLLGDDSIGINGVTIDAQLPNEQQN